MKKMKLAFAAFCAATFTAFASNVTAYRTLIGPEGWTKPDVETGVLAENAFGEASLSTKTPFSAVMRVTMPAKENVRYGSLVSFGKRGATHQITLTVVDVVGATSGSNSDTKGYIAGKNDAGADLGFPTDDALLPKDLFRAHLTYDVALTYDGEAFRLYVDGAPVTLSDASGKAVTATLTCAETLDLSDVCFGQRVSTVGTLNGGHDLTDGVWRDAVVFDAALSDLQVESIHAKGVWNFLYETQLLNEPAKEGETYVLDSPEDWQWFASMAPANANVRLGADLTLTAHRQVFKPAFSGTFDGNGHTVTLRPDATAQAEGTDGAGLVAGTLEGATVKHLGVRVEGGVLAQEGAAGAIAGVATDATLEDVVVTFPGTLEGGAVGGVVGEASGLTLKGVRLDFSGMALGDTVGGLVGNATGALTVEGSLLTFLEGDTVDALLAGDTVGAAVGQVGEGAALAGLTLVDTCLAGATAAVGAGTPTSGPTLRLAEGSALLKEGEDASLTSVRETLRTPTPTTFTVADALGEPVASEGWEVSGWDPEAKTFALAFVGADLAAAGTLTYEVAIMEPAEGATWQGAATVTHPLSNQTEDGWWVLDSEPDYAWFLASCPGDAKVRLAADITLQAKAYGQPRRFSKLEFDGQGYAIAFPEGAALKSEYCGIVAGSINQGTVKDVKVVIGGTLEGENGAYIGGIFGSSAYQQPSLSVTLTNAHVHLLPTARFTGDTFNAASLVGACYDGPVTVEDCSVFAERGATFAPSPLKYTVALTNERAKGAGKCTQANVLAVDLGVVMPSGSAYTRVSGATTYRGCNAPKNYGSSETLLAGDVTLEAGKPFTLAPAGLAVGEVTVPEGWAATRGEGNALTLTRTGEDDGTPCDFTYTLKQGETSFATIPVRAYFVQPVVADGDGVYDLGTEADYAWYLKFCPRGAKVRLTADIALRPRHYGKAWNPSGSGTLALDFDGQGHSIAFPAGATLLGEYCGVIAGQLRQGSIRDVTVLLGGTLEGENDSYTGGILGSTTYDGKSKEPVTLANVHVRLLGTARFTGDVYNAAGLVGACYTDPVTVTASSVVAEAGATFAPRKLGYSVALANGRAKDNANHTCTQTDVIAVDLGVVMPSGKSAPAYSRVDGATVYKSQNVTANYGEATTILAGEAVLDYGKPITLAPEGVTIAGVTLPEAWAATRTEGTNAFTFTSDAFVSEEDGTPCAFTYTVTKGDCAVDVPVAATFADHPILDREGWYNLDSEEDYAWYLAKCPGGSKVRLTGDIMLQEKSYNAYNPNKHYAKLDFDGQGHTVTLPQGATMVGEYNGVIAGEIKNGSIKDVNVVIGGTLTGQNGAYVGGVLGSSTYQTGGTVSLSNVHVRLLGTAKFTGNTWRAGGLVGLAYKDPVSVEGCSVVAEAGATIETVRDGAALTCGGRDTGASSGVYALDLGIAMPSDTSKYTTHSGETVYKGSTVTATYSTGSGTLATGTVAAGTLEGTGPWTLAPEGLTVQGLQAPEGGWTATLEGNALTLTGPAGATDTLTYGLAQFPLARIPLSVTLPAAYAFALPDGAQPSEALTAALEAAAQAAGLEPGAEPVTVELADKATLDALELFTGVCTADTEARTLTVAYDFGVTAIAVSDDRESVTVTVALRAASGTPAFAQGTQITLKATEGEALLGEPVFAPGAATAQIAFPLKEDTCTFRACASRAAE